MKPAERNALMTAVSVQLILTLLALGSLVMAARSGVAREERHGRRARVGGATRAAA